MTMEKMRRACAMIVNSLVQSSSDFLDAFAKLRKTNIRFVMSVWLSICPSVLPMEQVGFHWINFHKFLYTSISLKAVDIFQV
jgi:hypothetical protein